MCGRLVLLLRMVKPEIENWTSSEGITKEQKEKKETLMQQFEPDRATTKQKILRVILQHAEE